jgi:hypothetical protein
VGEENYSKGQLGRVTQVHKKVYNFTYTTSYAYNLAGRVAPAGRAATPALGGASSAAVAWLA